MPLDPRLSPEEIEAQIRAAQSGAPDRRQAVADAIAKLQTPDTSEIDDARQNALIQNIIATVGRAAEGYVRAPAIARGGQGVDPTVYNTIAQSGQQGIQAAQAKQDAVKKSILDAMALKHQVASEERMDTTAAEEARRHKEDEAIRREEIKRKAEADKASLGPKAMNDLDKAQAEHLRAQTAALTNKANKPVEKPTDMQHAYDTAAGEELANWNLNGGRTEADLSINKLKELVQKLANSKEGEISGGVINQAAPVFGETGTNLRDAMRPQTKGFRQDVSAALLPGLKTMFKGTTSDRELKTFMELGFDESLHPRDNALKLMQQIRRWEVRRDALDAMDKQFRATGKASGPTPGYPKTVVNANGDSTTVNNAVEEQDAAAEGFK